MRLLPAHQALESLIERNGSSKIYSARLTRGLEPSAHFSISVSHITGKHSARTDYLSINLSSPPQVDDVYDEEYKFNNIIQKYKSVTKFGCLGNNFNQSKKESTSATPHKAKNEPNKSKTREQIAFDCFTNTQNSHRELAKLENESEMDARTIRNLETAHPSAGKGHLNERRKDFVNPRICRQSGGRYKKPRA